MLRRQTQKTIIKTVAFLLASLLIGRYIVGPILHCSGGNVQTIFLGAAVLALVYQCRNALFSLKVNRMIWHKMRELLPDDVSSMRAIGVQTPIDFTYVVVQFLTYEPIQPFNNRPGRPEIHFDRKMYGDSIRLFEEMFGRKPMGSESFDWDYISRCEIAEEVPEALQKDFHVFGQDTEKLVSAPILEYFRNLGSVVVTNE